MIEHRSVANYLAAASQLYGVQASDRVLQFASISFDVSVREIFGSLTSGAALILCADRRQDSAQFFSDCQDRPLRWLACPRHTGTDLPALWTRKVGGFRHRCAWSAPVGRKCWLIAWRFGAVPLRNCRLINSYGPTETTVSAAASESRASRSARGCPDWPPDRQHANLHPRRSLEPGADRGSRRAAHRRQWFGARIPGSCLT